MDRQKHIESVTLMFSHRHDLEDPGSGPLWWDHAGSQAAGGSGV